MDNDITVLSEIKRILEEHKGKRNEVSAQIIEEKFGNPKDATHSKARDLIKQCIERFHLPIAANDKGYYYITSEDELKEYSSNLYSRAKEINDRAKKNTIIF